MLYQPTTMQIAAAASDLLGRHQDKAAMIERIEQGVEILRKKAFDVRRAGFFVDSQSRPGTEYTVNDKCTCPDHKRAPRHAGRSWCKHRIAIGIYKRLLLLELNKRIIGGRDAGNQHKQAMQPRTWLLIIRGSNLWSDTNGAVCTVNYGEKSQLWIPAETLDWLSAAEWLYKAADRPEAPTRDLPEHHHADEWKSAWNVADYQQWLKTGIVPTLR